MQTISPKLVATGRCGRCPAGQWMERQQGSRAGQQGGEPHWWPNEALKTTKRIRCGKKSLSLVKRMFRRALLKHLIEVISYLNRVVSLWISHDIFVHHHVALSQGFERDMLVLCWYLGSARPIPNTDLLYIHQSNGIHYLYLHIYIYIYNIHIIQ